MSKTEMHVVYTLDAAFVDYAAVSVVSLLDSQDAKCNVHFVHDGDLVDDESRLTKLVLDGGGCPSFHRIPDSFPHDLPFDKHASIANYYRLALAQIMPQHIGRIIYLDADTLIRRPLDELVHCDLGKSGFGAVTVAVESTSQLGLPPGAPYLNSGVLAIDLDVWRENGTSERLLKLAAQRSAWEYWDQDVFAVFFQGDWRRIPPEYNVSHRFFYGDNPLPLPCDDPFIIHFTGNGIKPWQTRRKLPFEDEFWLYAKQVQQEGFVISKPRERWYKTLMLTRFRRARREVKRKQKEQQVLAERARWENDFIARRCPDLRVVHGPFQGLQYPRIYSHGSALVPKLLGTYEAELHEIFELFSKRDYRLLIDIGAAEGYYAIGAARLWPDAKVVAYELVRSARQAVDEMAVCNGVRDRVDIQAECIYGDLRDQRALIICDIEGAEQSLLVNSGIAENLALADLVVEAHDFLCDGISDRLMQQFSDSHHVQMIESVADEERPRRFVVDEISDLTTEQQILALAERRPTVMRWIVCQSKTPFKQKTPAGPRDQGTQPRQANRLG